MRKSIRTRGGRQVCALILGIAALAVTDAVFAVVFEHLYTVTVPLNPADPAGRQPQTDADYARFAMSELLVRVTGQLDAPANPALGDLLRDADRYVVQRGNPDRDNLLIVFDASGLRDTLTQRNQPIWGEERPLTLLWVAIDGGPGERGILAADAAPVVSGEALQDAANALREELGAAAMQRGLPVTLPLMDLADMGALDFIDVWGGFAERLRQASARYAPDALLIGRIRLSGEDMEVAGWTLLRGSDQRLLPGDSIRSGLDGLADIFAGEFSGIGGLVSARVTVVDVENLDDYGRVVSYLEGLSVLQSVHLERMVGTELTLRVEARGGAEVLHRVVALSDVLTRFPAVDSDRLGGDLIYSLAH